MPTNKELLHDLVTGLINCKEDDLNYLLREYNIFNISIDESLQFCKEKLSGGDTPHINDLFRSIYMLSLKKRDLDLNDFQIECNYRESKLTHIPSGTDINDEDDFKSIVPAPLINGSSAGAFGYIKSNDEVDLQKITVRQYLQGYIDIYVDAVKFKTEVVWSNWFIKPLVQDFKNNYPDNYIDVVSMVDPENADIWLWPTKKDCDEVINDDSKYEVSKLLTFSKPDVENLTLKAQLGTNQKALDAVDVLDWPMQKLLDYFNEI